MTYRVLSILYKWSLYELTKANDRISGGLERTNRPDDRLLGSRPFTRPTHASLTIGTPHGGRCDRSSGVRLHRTLPSLTEASTVLLRWVAPSVRVQLAVPSPDAPRRTPTHPEAPRPTPASLTHSLAISRMTQSRRNHDPSRVVKGVGYPTDTTQSAKVAK